MDRLATPLNSASGAMPVWLDWVLSNTQSGLLLLDAQMQIVFANKWLLLRSALTSELVQGQPLVDVFPVLRGTHFERALLKSMQSGFPSVLSQTLHPTPFPLYAHAAQRIASKLLRQSIQIVPMGPKDAALAGQRYTLVQISDVTPNVLREGLLKAQADKMSDMAHVDGLTGIGNRRAFDEALASEMRAAVRTASPMGLLLLDIDHFKQFNDTYGHPAGDACLSAVAERLGSVCRRPRDRVARYGGEEMVVILPDTDLKGSLQVAAEILQSVRDLEILHAMSPVAKVVTLSAGISVLEPAEPQTGADLVGQADGALYAAKNAGRNCVYYYDTDSKKVVAA